MRVPKMTTRRLLIAAAVVAVALSVEAAITAMAFLALIRAVRRPRAVHLTTTILLTLLTGILLWANLRPTGWQEESTTRDRARISVLLDGASPIQPGVTAVSSWIVPSS
jgi:hypothetical protein